MKNYWDPEALIEQFTILPKEQMWIEEKRLDNRLGFAVLFKVFQQEARFPANPKEVPMGVVRFLAKQLKVPIATWDQYLGRKGQEPAIARRSVAILDFGMGLFKMKRKSSNGCSLRFGITPRTKRRYKPLYMRNIGGVKWNHPRMVNSDA
ncbi:protein of unknown function [Melghirimyces algeriensis]|uniref:DUF4158 domain-containing protein n=1 Tax=Melghirimyces algeriensis TaxID=910412 RepID=A0A521CEJ0_9BACL|nr:protein of unknown function [Melghirimyces algeriensis]